MPMIRFPSPSVTFGHLAMLGVLVAAMSACRRTSTVGDQQVVSDPAAASAPTDAGARARTDDATAPAPPSPFAVVARGSFELTRIWKSPVLAVSYEGNAIWELGETGAARLVKPLSERTLTTEQWPLRIGRVTGRWPEALRVELGSFNGRGGSVIHNWTFDVAKDQGMRTGGAASHIASSSPWGEGAELAWEAEDTSSMGDETMPRAGSFVQLAGPRKALPKLPKTVAAARGVVAAYESGRVFLAAGVRGPKEADPVDLAHVWSFNGTDARAMKTRGQPLHLVRGRREEETLLGGATAQGAPFIDRFDGTTWVDVPVTFREPILALDSTDDGSVWILSGTKLPDGRVTSSRVFLGTFPELRFVEVPLPKGLIAMSLAATSARDAWVTARTATFVGYGAELLLHQQATAPADVPTLPSDPEDVARVVYGDREIAAYTPSCTFPFVVVGKEGELTLADLKAFVATDKVDGQGVLVRAPSGERLYGIERRRTLSPTEAAEDRKVLAAARTRWKSAKLVCTRLPIVTELPDAAAK